MIFFGGHKGEDGYSDMNWKFSNGCEVTDQQVYEYAKKHTRLLDRLFNPHKFSDAVLMSFDILATGVKVKNEDAFKF